MLLLSGILVTAGMIAFVLAPLVRRTGAPLTDGPDIVAQLRELYALREVAYETIRDLEFDAHAGKIAEPDFRELSDRYKREALRIVQRIEEVEAGIRKPPGGRRGRT